MITWSYRNQKSTYVLDPHENVIPLPIYPFIVLFCLSCGHSYGLMRTKKNWTHKLACKSLMSPQSKCTYYSVFTPPPPTSQYKGES